MGFFRVAITAYLLGTHSAADALAVAQGPIDTLNGALITTMIFACVPMLVLAEGGHRVSLFRQARGFFLAIFGTISLAIVVFADRLIRVLGGGLTPEFYPVAVNILRITAISTFAAGGAALHFALLFTERKFGATALYQAALNLFTIIGALVFWKALGIYGFALGYTLGALVQFAFAYFHSRPFWQGIPVDNGTVSWHELLTKPGSFLIYAGLLALNIIVTRAYASHAGSGMAAAFDYTIRCVNVVVAYLVAPVSNSLLPEIAHLRREDRASEAFGLSDRAIRLAALASLAACVLGIIFGRPVIALMFQRGNFTAESTTLVAGIFLGLAPVVIGMSLLELQARTLFSLDRRWLPVTVAFVPATVNWIFCALVHPARPELIGLGASLGLTLAFGVLFAVAQHQRGRWSHQTKDRKERDLVAISSQN